MVLLATLTTGLIFTRHSKQVVAILCFDQNYTSKHRIATSFILGVCGALSLVLPHPLLHTTPHIWEILNLCVSLTLILTQCHVDIFFHFTL